MILSYEKLLIKERLEKILLDWDVSVDLEVTNKTSNFCISSEQINQIHSIGLTISEICRINESIVISFAGVPGGEVFQ